MYAEYQIKGFFELLLKTATSQKELCHPLYPGEAAQTVPHPHPHAGHLIGEASLDDGQIYDMSDLC